MILFALILLQPDPRVEKVERLAVDVPRPYAWTPLAVTVSSTAGFQGDLRVRSRFGFSVVRRVDIPKGGDLRVIVPALDPEAVEIGGGSVPVPRPGGRADLVVAVEAGLPYAAELRSDARARYSTVGREDLRLLLAGGMMDGVDLLLLGDASGLDAGAAAAWVVAPTREAADRAIAAARPAARVEAVDAPVWDLAPEGGWVPAKRANGVLFAAGYALAAFAGLAVAARRGGKALALTIAGAALAGAGAFALLFPRGQVWVEEIALDAPETERRIWFAGAATPSETSLEFPRLAKPVYREASGSARTFSLRVNGRGCVAEGLALGPGDRVCFASMSAGRLPELPGEEAAPSDPLRKAFERFFDGRAPRVRRESAPVGDVEARNLADARRRARVQIPR